jgi:hypothetical protein
VVIPQRKRNGNENDNDDEDDDDWGGKGTTWHGQLLQSCSCSSSSIFDRGQRRDLTRLAAQNKLDPVNRPGPGNPALHTGALAAQTPSLAIPKSPFVVGSSTPDPSLTLTRRIIHSGYILKRKFTWTHSFDNQEERQSRIRAIF